MTPLLTVAPLLTAAPLLTTAPLLTAAPLLTTAPLLSTAHPLDPDVLALTPDAARIVDLVGSLLGNVPVVRARVKVRVLSSGTYL